MATVNEKMTALADAVRSKTSRTDALTLDEMTVAVQGIDVGEAEDLEAELTAQENLISQLGTILDSKASGGSDGEIETCSVTIHAPGGLRVFGWGECTVNIANNILGPYTLPTTEPSGHTIVADAIYTFDELPVGAVFTFYHETNKISNIEVMGNIEYSFVNHKTTQSAEYNFAMCKCNGSGSIVITC